MSKFVIVLGTALKVSEDGSNDCGSGSSEEGGGSLKGHLNHGTSVGGGDTFWGASFHFCCVRVDDISSFDLVGHTVLDFESCVW